METCFYLSLLINIFSLFFFCQTGVNVNFAQFNLSTFLNFHLFIMGWVLCDKSKCNLKKRICKQRVNILFRLQCLFNHIQFDV